MEEAENDYWANVVDKGLGRGMDGWMDGWDDEHLAR